IELARGGAIEDPGPEHAILDDRERACRHALAVERPRALPALAQRIVDDADAGPEQPLRELVTQEAGLARDGIAVDGAGQVADRPAGDAAIEHDWHFLGRDLARIEPRDGALAGRAPDPIGRIEIGGMERRGEIIVALHRGALARDRAHAD